MGSNKIRCRKFAKSTINYDFEFRKPTYAPGDIGAADLNVLELQPIEPSAMRLNAENFKVGDYVAILVNEALAFGTITDKNEDDQEYGLKLMQKCRRGKSYKFRDPERIICLVQEGLICSMPAPATLTGRNYDFYESSVLNATIFANRRIRQLAS